MRVVAEREEQTLNRNRIAVLIALASIGLLAQTRETSAAAEVHRFNLVIAGNPTSIDGGGFNDRLDEFNDTMLTPRGLERLKSLKFGWLFETSFMYFVRPNVAVRAGVGQLRTQSQREFLPALDQTIQLRAEILSVPVLVGGAYYLQPYNQGDFQARAYFGAGFESLVYNRARFQSVEVATDPGTTLGGTYVVEGRRDSPGYYLETGVHMFFAVRHSVMLAATYRSAHIRDMNVTLTTPGGSVLPLGNLFDLDTSGVGGRMALAIGF